MSDGATSLSVVILAETMKGPGFYPLIESAHDDLLNLYGNGDGLFPKDWPRFLEIHFGTELTCYCSNKKSKKKTLQTILNKIGDAYIKNGYVVVSHYLGLIVVSSDMPYLESLNGQICFLKMQKQQPRDPPCAKSRSREDRAHVFPIPINYRREVTSNYRNVISNYTSYIQCVMCSVEKLHPM